MSKTEQESPFGFDPEIDVAHQEHSQWLDPNLVSRKWGTYEVLTRRKNWVVKILTILPQKSISLQKHQYRAERWFILEGKGIYASKLSGATKIKKSKKDTGATIFIPPDTWHWIKNTSGNELLIILETWFGEKLEESDIERKEDESEIIISK
jgi:mannose-6-phosphate isomerase-like protein (cupin superfamily)